MTLFVFSMLNVTNYVSSNGGTKRELSEKEDAMKRFTIALLVAVTLSLCLTSLAEAREPIYPRTWDRYYENDNEYRLPLLRRILFHVVVFQGPW